MRQPNGCSAPAPKSSAAKQWIEEELARKKKKKKLLQCSEPNVEYRLTSISFHAALLSLNLELHYGVKTVIGFWILKLSFPI